MRRVIAPEMKQQAQELYETSRLKLREIALRVGVSEQTIRNWVREWQEGEPDVPVQRRADPEPPALPVSDAPLSPEEARRLLASEARHGKNPTQAIKADFALRKHGEVDAGLQLPVPLTEDEVVRELAELLRASGPRAAEAAWEMAWPTLEAPPGQYVEWWEGQKQVDEEVRRTTNELRARTQPITNRSRMW